jgi:hypothetical protein
MYKYCTRKLAWPPEANSPNTPSPSGQLYTYQLAVPQRVGRWSVQSISLTKPTDRHQVYKSAPANSRLACVPNSPSPMGPCRGNFSYLCTKFLCPKSTDGQDDGARASMDPSYSLYQVVHYNFRTRQRNRRRIELRTTGSRRMFWILFATRYWTFVFLFAAACNEFCVVSTLMMLSFFGRRLRFR